MLLFFVFQVHEDNLREHWSQKNKARRGRGEGGGLEEEEEIA